MAFFAPAVTDEADAVATFIVHQLHQVRLTASGLDEEQARRVLPPSTLSIGGLLAHLAQGVHTWLVRVEAAPERPTDDQLAAGLPAAVASDWHSGSEIPAGFTLPDLLAAFDDVVAHVRPVVEAASFDAPLPVPDAPWFPDGTARLTARWVFLHLAAEVARHAGHADLIRESIDGAVAYELNAAGADRQV